MYCIQIVEGKECGFEYDPDEKGTPARQHASYVIKNHERTWYHAPVWSTESEE